MKRDNQAMIAVFLVMAAAGCVGDPKPAETEAPPVAEVVQVSGVKGTIQGTRVNFSMAEFDGQLALFEEEGWAWSPSLLVFLFLDGEGVPENRRFIVAPDEESGGDTPHVHYRWRGAGSGGIQVDSVMNGYSMMLEFGEVSAGMVPGRIEFSVPGSQTSVSGSFLASVR